MLPLELHSVPLLLLTGYPFHVPNFVGKCLRNSAVLEPFIPWEDELTATFHLGYVVPVLGVLGL